MSDIPGVDVQWGVRYPDSSVTARWCGSTARQRCIEEALSYNTSGHRGVAQVVWRRWPRPRDGAPTWHEGEPAPNLSDRAAVEEWLNA